MPGVRFLSPEWLAALDDAARSRVPAADDPLASVRFTIEQRVVDGPTWRFVVRDGSVAVETGSQGEADVRLTSDRATAAAIASGQRPALDAFIAGDLTLGGDVGALLEHRAALETVGDLFAQVRRRTQFT